MSNSRVFGIYGFGRAGRSLAKSLASNPDYRVITFSRRADAERQEFSKNTGVKLFDREGEFLNAIGESVVEALFLAVPDDAVAGLASNLMQAQSLPSLVSHLSGVLSAMELDALSGRTAVAQFHPLASLDGAQGIPAQCLIGIHCEDKAGLEKLSNLAVELGCVPALLNSGDQGLYHAAAVLTGNLSFGLVSLSQKLFERCGVPKRTAEIALAQLLKSAAHALEKNELEQALTGPLKRGDVQTIAKHMAALQSAEISPELLAVYSLLSNELIDRVGLTHMAPLPYCVPPAID